MLRSWPDLHAGRRQQAPAFSVFEQPDAIRCQLSPLQCDGQVFGRLIEGFLCQFEGAPVQANGFTGVKVQHDLYGVIRIGVLWPPTLS